ncbi:UDP-glucose:undecaprenyl-phosphate glucose-1-phosphate transferase [Shewanella sp. P1-14-1]|uniref:undecaprenyl-phosphate glucose phosphotransferase n=1 Tax=Shewanella sp. P1-14-1 TaxID=1723761 RepID=UPI0006D681A0|nr:undecaprenyl-phosphate glucose phosphotransferase [Shewanella sp. P1-14-1]KPZ72577.1 UDP-glucose:undecaprenyl-phosphate glucose-1-phosphate transferase [Shewanella sp. P1-14-1]
MLANNSFSLETDGYSFLYRLVDIFIIITTFVIAALSYGIEFSQDYFTLIISTLLIYAYLSESMQLYRSWRVGKFSKMILLLSCIVSLTFMCLSAILFIFKLGDSFSRVVIVGWFFSAFILLISWRVVTKVIKSNRRKSGRNNQDIAIIGLTKSGYQLYDEIEQHFELGFRFAGFYDDRQPDRMTGLPINLLEGNIDKAIDLAKAGRIQKLYICLPMVAEKRIAEIIKKTGDTTVDVFIIPDFMLKNLMQARIGSVGSIDTISVFESPLNGMKHFYKRTFDIIFSAVAITALSPLLIAISIAIMLNSKGAVIFKQDRYGLDGRKIKVWKFRSMTVVENASVVTQATKGDARITSVGRFLRRTSLDELPQFFNVLFGDMSVVGPRPHAVAHNEEYRSLVSYYMLRHKVVPGITGWAQINGWRGETDTLDKMEKRVEFDLAYIRNWSLMWDFKIVFMTIFKGFVGKNAY